MPSTCTFQLNKNPPVYYSGEFVAGNVILNTISEKNLRSIRLGLLGESKVKWDETTASTSSTSTNDSNCFHSHIVYINDGTDVMYEGVLPSGTHTYNFNILLPIQCPTSCEGKYGHVRYELSLVLNRKYRFDNVFRKPITVIQTADLNLNPNFRLSLKDKETSSLGVWPLNQGKLFSTLTIQFAAYAPGQHMKYTLHLQNQSTTDTEGYILKFKQKYTFIATKPYKKVRSDKNILLQVHKSDRCLRSTTRIFEGLMQIPAIPPTTYRSDATIICVDYYFKAIVQISGLHRSAKLKVPIYIGTIPLRESIQMPYQPELQRSCDTLATFNDSDPPTFEEAMCIGSTFVDTDIDEQNRTTDFRSMYQMYSNKQLDKQK